MPIINSISNMKEEMQEWRRYLHTIPELGFEEFKTAQGLISNVYVIEGTIIILNKEYFKRKR